MIKDKQSVLKEANHFIGQCYRELGRESDISPRLKEIDREISLTGTYEHTYDELILGARMAWRNSNRCIGRLFWNSLHVLDARSVDDEDDMYQALLHHISYASNEGRILPTITIFKQHKNHEDTARIYNHQLIRYAGYNSGDGVKGDPHSLHFTKMCSKLGWQGEKTNYDVLPFVFSINGRRPVCRNVPKTLIKEVEIRHPDYPFEELGMKWYGVPIISDMRLEIGGVSYHAAPFNGWYMGTEIGARNLADEHRYHVLPRIAEVMGLSTNRNDTLWKDKALIELNVAVLNSFKKAGITIVDHHTAAAQFRLFEEQEAKGGRMVTGDWTWLIPPLSPATTHIFHQDYRNEREKPNFFPQ
ncbi:MAG: nitric oxide synthase oxygenase [Bacillus sp. (in: firmicutes)]